MIVCSQCGYKRCPKAHDHNFKCTSSNDPAQTGNFDSNTIMGTARQISGRQANDTQEIAARMNINKEEYKSGDQEPLIQTTKE